MMVHRAPLPPNDEDAPRRAIPRVDGTYLAWAVVEGQSSGALGRTIDLSSRGVGLMVTRPIEVGTVLSVEFKVTPIIRLRARGTVQHCRPTDGGHRVGVRFDAPPFLIDPSSSNSPK